MDDFVKTPSFYNNEEVFKKYLGQTSYYLGLQEKVAMIVQRVNPKRILELGFGAGHTAINIAKQNGTANVTAIDIRPDMVAVAQSLAEKERVTNITFQAEDMAETVQREEIAEYDILYLLYSFHHIPDPVDLKISFLQSCSKNMKPGSYLCVAETFIPDGINYIGDEDILRQLWDARGQEGYISTYWNSLRGISPEDIKLSEDVAAYCYKMEVAAGENVINRENEYLIKRIWLKTQAEKQGFRTVLDAAINNVGDAILLFRCI